MKCTSRLLALCALAFAVVAATRARAAAATLPAPPPPSAAFDVGTVHVVQYGRGARSLIFIPGLSSGPWSFYGTIAHFAPSYTIYALTLPGFDGQPPTAARPLFATVENDVWRLLAQRHIQQPVVIGHSLGGTLAIALGEAHPERLRAVVAVDGLPVFPAMVQLTPQARTAAGTRASAALAALSPHAWLAYETRYMDSEGTDHHSLVAASAAELAKSDPASVGSWLGEDLATDLRPALAKLTVPLLEIAPYDPPSPYTQAQTKAFYAMLLAGAPHVRVAIVTPAKHFVMLDRPGHFYAALARFLDSLP